MRAQRLPAPSGLVLFSLVLAGLVLAGSACSSSGRATSRGRGASQGPAPASSAPAPSTSTTVSTPPTTTYIPPSPRATPFDAAAALMQAWAEGDRSTAASVAAPAAVATLFAITYPSGWLQFRGCTARTTDPGTCTYRNTYTNGLYQLGVTQAPAGWYVSSVTPES